MGVIVRLLRLLVKWRLLWFIVVAILFLSGCVRDDVAVTFQDANHGQIVQHIRLKSQSNSIRDGVAIAWLERLERQAQQLGAQVRHPSARPELIITLPFYNAQDLETKFNRLLQPESDGQSLQSHLTVGTNNLVVMQRQRWRYDLDLREATLAVTAGPLANTVQPESLDLELSLATPWGAHISANSLAPTIRHEGRLLIWTLQPGQVNHVEATFWVPSYLGIGFVVIAIAVVGGLVVKILLTPAVDLV